MAFNKKTNWRDYPDTSTPIKAADLLRYEDGIADNEEAINILNADEDVEGSVDNKINKQTPFKFEVVNNKYGYRKEDGTFVEFGTGGGTDYEDRISELEDKTPFGFEIKDGKYGYDKEGTFTEFGEGGGGGMPAGYSETSIFIGQKASTTLGERAVAEGKEVTASGKYSHAEGYQTTASNMADHAEGTSTTAKGQYSHAEGGFTTAGGQYSHSEGYNTNATNKYSHAEGYQTTAGGEESHAEGYYTLSRGYYSHSEGGHTNAIGYGSHAEGIGTTAVGQSSHSSGQNTVAGFDYQFVIGKYNNNKYDNVFEIGFGTSDSDRKNVFEVSKTGVVRHLDSTGKLVDLTGGGEGGGGSLPEGYGKTSIFIGQKDLVGYGMYANALGYNTNASGNYSYASGKSSTAKGEYSHSEGNSLTANYDHQFVIGKYNKNSSNNIFEIGFGESSESTKNIFEVTNEGDCRICDSDGNLISIRTTANELKFSIDTLNGDNLTEGSVDYKIQEAIMGAIQRSY